MINTTLCYLEHGGCWLMLHRVKKQQDLNAGKWIGVGGKLEENESPEEGCRREILEETGLRPRTLRYRGLITFVAEGCEGEYMHLFDGQCDGRTVIPCDEGELAWIPKRDVPGLNLWQGDRLFLRQLQQDGPFFTMKLVYRGDALQGAWLNGEPIPTEGGSPCGWET